ncbi:MAG TPA: precorrin-2 C(20)-methyltransferase [Candidatus Mediterraneibacter stercoripullorum]|nr:precorrin-2 C(20)-methyltransferase [Candidatus Mediterraneibacter stercoripullorum]
MTGTFTGVGVGPGDPELMTIRAVRAIRGCSTVAVPISDRELEHTILCSCGAPKENRVRKYLEGCTAWQIAGNAVPELDEKQVILLPMPMVRDRDRLKEIHDRDAAEVAKLLDEGQQVVFLTLGDPTVYSTCMYIHKRLKAKGYPTEIVPGVPSFCAAAARMDISLVENRDELHVLPASYDIEKSLELPGTKVLMKSGKKISDVRRLLLEKGLEAEMVENCGMENERVYLSAEEIPEEAGYYSLLIVKERKGDGRR